MQAVISITIFLRGAILSTMHLGDEMVADLGTLKA